MSLFEGAESTAKNEFPLTARAELVSHLGFRDINTLFQPVDTSASDIQIFEDLIRSAIRYSKQVFFGVEPRSPHLQKYGAWLKKQEVASSEHIHGTEPAELIQSIAQSLDSSSLSYAAKAILNICSNIDSILSGKRNVYDVLATDVKFLEFMSEYDESKFFRDLGHFKPNLRVLELGAGSAAATTKILQCRRRTKGQNLFSRYVLADASMGLIDVAKARSKGFTNLEFAGGSALGTRQ